VDNRNQCFGEDQVTGQVMGQVMSQVTGQVTGQVIGQVEDHMIWKRGRWAENEK